MAWKASATAGVLLGGSLLLFGCGSGSGTVAPSGAAALTPSTPPDPGQATRDPVITTRAYTASPNLTGDWSGVRSVRMGSSLDAFWNVGGLDAVRNNAEAVNHGFTMVDLVGLYGGQAPSPTNPWQKPAALLENSVRPKVASSGGNALFVNDVEVDFQPDAAKAWADPDARQASGATTLDEFRRRYLAQWATWFSLPCRWAKEAHPQEPVGLYGPQPFGRDYSGLLGGAAQLEEQHRFDDSLWRYIDPSVDFYVSSIYVFYDRPDSIYYMAANVEENYLRTRKYGNKPVYAYFWLRYHDSNKALAGQELSPYLVEAGAVVPYFSGARGVVLWGSSREPAGQPYRSLPLFAASMGRLSDLTGKMARATLVIDEPAYVLWQQRRPLVRKLRVSDTEWIVMIANPWQGDQQESRVPVSLGSRTVSLPVRGKHTEVYDVGGSSIVSYSVVP